MNIYAVFLALLLTAGAACASEPDPPTGSTALLCQMSRHGMITTETLALDYDQKTVNGAPASFGGSMITWTVKNGSEDEHHELNRLTGTYNYWNTSKTSSEPMPTFVCVKAPMKF